MSRFSIDKAGQLKQRLAILIREGRQLERATERMSGMDLAQCSQRALSGANLRCTEIAESVNRELHECHVLAVELGIADRRGDECYQDSTLDDGWHQTHWVRRAPEESEA